MKVLHLSVGFPLTFPGGIPNYLRTLTRDLTALGVENRVVSASGNDPGQAPAGVALTEYDNRILPFTLRFRKRDAGFPRLRRMIEDAAPDLIHVHMAVNLAGDFYAWLEQSRIPYVVSLHDYFFVCPRIYMLDSRGGTCRSVKLEKCRRCVGLLDQVDFFRRAAHRLGLPLPSLPSRHVDERMAVMREFLGGAGVLLAVSKRVGDIFREVVPEAHIVVEHIGSASALAEPEGKSPSSRIRFVSIGTMSRHKGAALYLDIVRRVRRKDVEFHFHGRTYEGWKPRLERAGVIFHGAYTPADLPGILRDADVGVFLPVWEDNGPQVVMEFVNHRTPVLATRMGGIPDLVPDEAGHLFDPFDRAQIDEAVAWIERVQPDDLEVMARSMRRLTSPAQHAAAVLDHYRRVLAGAVDRGPAKT